MGRKLRIFVSSTMKDLANERLAVCQRLTSFNFESVNAEDLGPSGGNSWERIQPEIASSDLMILLLGERYGWIPEDGPGAELKVSVTELEVNEARMLGIPILPFEKRLGDDADRTSDDAKRRDEFRKRVKDWKNPGLFVQAFDWAPDLAEKVGKAVIEMVVDNFQRHRISARADAVTLSAEARQPLPASERPPFPSIPSKLCEAVQKRTAVLFAGSGISLSAGFPSAEAFAERFVQLIKEKQPDYSWSPAASAFAALATDLENLRGRHYVTGAIRALMEPPQNPQPTPSHEHAVRLFPRIITTNYDTLFERAAQAQALAIEVVQTEIATDVLPRPVIVKLHGSCYTPESLMINERDIILFDEIRPQLWKAVQRLLREYTVVIIGSSLRDPSVLRLFSGAVDPPCGYFVSPSISPSIRSRVSHFNLECIEAASDDFMTALARDATPSP